MGNPPHPHPLPPLSGGRGSKLEWLETNGLGGYAFGTSTGHSTRRYHGLLISARKPPVDRRMIISGLMAEIETSDGRLPLDPAPDGTRRGAAVDFLKDPFPMITYRISRKSVLCRIVFMRNGHNQTVVRYRLSGETQAVRLSLRILPAMRDHNHIHGTPAPPRAEAERIGRHEVRLLGSEDAAHLWHGSGEFVPDPITVGPFHYEWETRQGMDDREWIYSPGRMVADLSVGQGLDLVLSDVSVRSPRVAEWAKEEALRRRRLRAGAGQNSMRAMLLTAADQFLVARPPNRRTLVAGYPWFTDWGRDTMISLEGLTLIRREFDAAQDILSVFAGAESQGMIPNHYPEAEGEPHYNTVDASLWFFEAAWKFLRYTRRDEFVRRKLYPVFQSILRHHLDGTRFNIHAETGTGLLFSGEEGTQLTWMDAKVDDWVVTPRHGYPVEIQALWYNALRIFARLSEMFNKQDTLAGLAAATADRCKSNFSGRYWNPSGGYLHDGLTPDWKPVTDLRPNQLIALSLTHPILDDHSRGRRLLSVVRKKLLTPYGLRTLSPDHPDYKGRHEGSRLERDAAYHQGTVWPWLIGPYARACLAAEGRTGKTRSHLRRILRGFEKHLRECVVGTVSEIFDGDAPHQPKGCVAQAWSVAELIVMDRLARG